MKLTPGKENSSVHFGRIKSPIGDSNEGDLKFKNFQNACISNVSFDDIKMN